MINLEASEVSVFSIHLIEWLNVHQRWSHEELYLHFSSSGIPVLFICLHLTRSLSLSIMHMYVMCTYILT